MKTGRELWVSVTWAWGWPGIILEGGFPLDRLRPSGRAFDRAGEVAGGTAAESCREVGEQSDVVFVMVLNGDQVKQVVLQARRACSQGMQPGTTIIVSATINPAEVRELGGPGRREGHPPHRFSGQLGASRRRRRLPSP